MQGLRRAGAAGGLSSHASAFFDMPTLFPPSSAATLPICTLRACVPPSPPPLIFPPTSTHTAVIARKRFAIVGDPGDGGADATLPGVLSPLELVFEAHLDARAAAQSISLTLIGGGSVAINGAPLTVGERVSLAPGARLVVDGCEWEVWRNEAAHA